MGLEFELALRMLARRRGLLLRGTSLAALAGVALATAALVITLALMTGYRGSIATALQRGNAHLVGFALEPMGMGRARALAGEARKIPGVRRATPVTYLTGLAEDPANPGSPLPVVIKATLDPPAFTGFREWPEEGGEIPVVLGYRLAESLGVGPGDTVRVLLPPEEGSWLLPSLPLHVVGTFHLAFSSFDERWMVAPLGRLLPAVPDLGVAGVEVGLADPMAVESVRPSLEAAWPGMIVNDWLQMNPALFTALRWQTLSLFVVLSLVAAVASFQVSSALVVVAAQKRRTTGMLQALGMERRSIRRILAWVGLVLGGAGVLAGLAVGVAASLLMTWFRVIRFPPGMARIYMVEFIPLTVDPVHVLAVLAVCFLVVLGASLWPAVRAARLDPVAALRAV